MAQLSDPQEFERAYDDHGRGVYAAALRILGNPAQAQDVTQDVFMRVWRRPAAFDARRGELGSYLRLMARSRALDLWREGQAAGRMSDRLKVVVEVTEPAVEDAPAPALERDESRAQVRSALHRLPIVAARGARARLLGRHDGRRDRAAARTSRSAPPRAASGSGSRGCARSARTCSSSSCRSNMPPERPLSSNARSTAEPRHTTCRRAGDPLPGPRRAVPDGANPRLMPR